MTQVVTIFDDPWIRSSPLLSPLTAYHLFHYVFYAGTSLHKEGFIPNILPLHYRYAHLGNSQLPGYVA